MSYISLTWLKLFANKYLGGEYGPSYDDILEFDPLNGQWKLVARMIQARERHAVSVIEYREVEQFCTEEWTDIEVIFSSVGIDYTWSCFHYFWYFPINTI